MSKTLSETLRLFDFPGASVSELLRPLADEAERLERENAELAAACEALSERLEAMNYPPDVAGFVRAENEKALALGSTDCRRCRSTLDAHHLEQAKPVPADKRKLPARYGVHAWSKGGLCGEFEDRARFIVHPSGDREHGEHPNEKPFKVMRKLVRLACSEGGLVVDPYMGSGTTGIACLRTGRRFIGIEREQKWFDIAVERHEKEAKRYALLEPTGSAKIQRELALRKVEA